MRLTSRKNGRTLLSSRKSSQAGISVKPAHTATANDLVPNGKRDCNAHARPAPNDSMQEFLLWRLTTGIRVSQGPESRAKKLCCQLTQRLPYRIGNHLLLERPAHTLEVRAGLGTPRRPLLRGGFAALIAPTLRMCLAQEMHCSPDRAPQVTASENRRPAPEPRSNFSGTEQLSNRLDD